MKSPPSVFINQNPWFQLRKYERQGICPNETDQFAVSNNKARLIYPIGLLQSEERYNINNPTLLGTGNWYWGISPSSYYDDANVLGVDPNGGYNDFTFYTTRVYGNGGIRPVISLASFNTIKSGTGSETDPWVIG